MVLRRTIFKTKKFIYSAATKKAMVKEEKKDSDGKAPEGLPDIVEGQQCPACGKNTLTLVETQRDIAFFGKVFIYSMDCSACGFHKADVESEKGGQPVKITFEVAKEDDLRVRVIKSSTATVKLPRITTIEPGPAANGYVTNIEGILNRVRVQLENVRDNSEDDDDRNKAKSLLKKLRRIMWQEETLVITIEDPEGNSAIISEKAVMTKGKPSKSEPSKSG